MFMPTVGEIISYFCAIGNTAPRASDFILSFGLFVLLSDFNLDFRLFVLSDFNLCFGLFVLLSDFNYSIT